MTLRALLAFLLYVVGVCSGALLIGVAVLGDYEATAYGFMRRASEPLRGLSCPILLARDESGEIALTVSNPLERVLRPSVRIETSSRPNPDVLIESILLAPGESKTLKWQVGREQVDLGNFIFASVQVYGTYPIPSRVMTCGIFVTDIPVRGSYGVFLLVAISLFGLGSGLWLANQTDLRRSGRATLWNAMRVLAGLTLLGFVFSFQGVWLLAVVVLVLIILLSLLMLNMVVGR